MKKLSKKWWRTAKLVLPPPPTPGLSLAGTSPATVRQIIAAMKIADHIWSGDSGSIGDDLVRDLTAGPLSPDIALITVAQ